MVIELDKRLKNAINKVDFSDLSVQPILEEQDKLLFFSFPDDELQDIKIDINYSISLIGMDNQDTVNELGKDLYCLYDELLYQSKQMQ